MGFLPPDCGENRFSAVSEDTESLKFFAGPNLATAVNHHLSPEATFFSCPAKLMRGALGGSDEDFRAVLAEKNGPVQPSRGEVNGVTSIIAARLPKENDFLRPG